ncbi:discoidin domain-containing protein [Rhizobium sp. BG4]|uniref:galactose-binding domain-containing protein n=1 Tax=Rhizobium sp. BG4 TaxID=2613770 RepID=UPI00193E9E66|nr:discoidin domain-containing protein [Rhizobium sp. BG4]QRM43975.1 discoidin domain-containing protein [Rhizobium sp. BG4]
MSDYYTTGQITLTNGSASIVGVGTAWVIANVAGGTIFAEAAGNPLPLASIEDDTHATAAIKWTGATGTYDYALLRATAFSEQLEANSNIMSRLLVGMEAGTIYRYDVSGDLADKATYDERPDDFAFLAIDVNPAQLFIKASDASGDWAGPFSYGQGEQGDEGPPGPAAIFNWRGAYSGATTYAKNDGVRGDRRSFVSLQDGNVGHALPVFPATTNAWWDLTAERGADGTGTGDVVGPDGATDWALSFYNGVTGKLLRAATIKEALDAFRLGPVFGGPPPLPSEAGVGLSDGDFNAINYAGCYTIAGSWTNGTSGAGAATYTGVLEVRTRRYTNLYIQYFYTGDAVYRRFTTTTGGLSGWSAWRQVDLSVGTAAGTVAAGDDARFGQGGKNDALLALEIADLKGSRMGMAGGIADAFDDETGVNTGGSTNQAYDAGNDWYKGSSVESSQIPALTSNSGAGVTVSASSVLSAGSTDAWYAADADSTNTFWHSASGLPATWFATFSAAKRITSYRLRWRDETSALPTAWTVSGSNDNSAWTVIDTRTAQTPSKVSGGSLYQIATPGSYLYYRIVFSTSDNAYASMRNIQLNIDTLQNMTLVSAAYTAASVPSTARLAVQTAETDAVTVNTDLTGEVSRDGGTTWTAVTLALSTNLNGVKVYEGTATISGQPSGTSMRWRVKTLNNKNVAVSGVVLQWS